MDEMNPAAALDRRAAMMALLADRPDDLLVVSGLGSTTWDVAAAGDDARNFYLWGAMGGAAMVGLGLALAQPAKPVAVITGDGEMLMGLGALSTIGSLRPPNLAVIVFDNGLYGETGGQPSHTSGRTRLTDVARGCGIARCLEISDAGGLATLRGAIAAPRETLLAVVRISGAEPPRVLPLRDGAEIKRRFRAALGLSSRPAAPPPHSGQPGGQPL